MAGASRDRIREEIARFRESGMLADARAARLVCWGTTLGSGQEKMLIEDPERFPLLLDKVADFRVEPRPYRRCWRGLLEGYLTYDPDSGAAAGKANWTLLRSYLEDARPALDRSGFVPDWLATIDDHSNLLKDAPCDRYGLDLLNGDTNVLEPLRSTLGIGDASWVMRSAIEAQIARALALDDNSLREVLPRLIALLEEHELLADGGLARLLDRYVVCNPLVVEPTIRDYSVLKWGNPWLERNDSQWSRIREDSRKMVSDWLKLDFIEQFFSLLSADQLNDARRLAFWKRYHRQIDDMYFALGDTASRNTSADFKTLRKRMSGRILTLENGGTPNNNAFIMRIGGYVFVEFGEKGNAMFAFDGKNLPFNLSRSWVEGNKDALKHPSHVERIIHMDSRWETWEDKIAVSIEQLTGCRPDEAGPARRPTRSPAAVPPSAPAKTVGHSSQPSTPAQPSFPSSSWQAPKRHSASPSDTEVNDFLLANLIRTSDMRPKGGSLWVYAAQQGAIGRQLKEWGFTWSERRGAWYGKSN